MSFSDRQIAIPLKIITRVRQRGVSPERLGNRAFVPEPGASNFVLIAAEAAIVTDRILVIPDWRDG